MCCIAVVGLVTAVIGSGGAAEGAVRGTTAATAATFHYGFDLTVQEPAATGGRLLGAMSGANSSALHSLGQFSGAYVDQSMYGFGATDDPEPEPGVFNMSSIASRVSMIQSSGGVPVITLIGAPSWMRPGSKTFYTPPAPQYYQAFATLCAHVAVSFPQVKYFVVWNELKGFWDDATNTWNIAGYTTMYNDVFNAIKRVRSTAQVGGPYVSMAAWPTRHGALSTLDGSYGFVERSSINALNYWLTNKVGADFVAVDGATENGKAGAPLENAVQAASLYSSVDAWIERRSTLPIWWMESHIQPAGWSTAQGAAARIATLAEMAASGARVGMQWQPQDQVGWPDEGLWTSTMSVGGGQETLLGKELLSAMPVLEHGPVLASSEPSGVLVATDANGTVAVNTNASPAMATVRGTLVQLAGGQVLAN